MRFTKFKKLRKSGDTRFHLYSIFDLMKRIIPFLLISACFFGCSHPNYKLNAIEYLKKNVPNPASVDTIRFLKPDSIYATFHDEPEYRTLMVALNNFYIQGDSAQIKQVKATIADREKHFKHKVTGWDVSLIYKAKDKKGVMKTDTCRFLFESTLTAVRDVNGVDIK